MDPRMLLLYSIYVPDRDPTTLSTSPSSSYKWTTELRDVNNVRPAVEPPYSHAEKLALEDWRKQVEQQMWARICSYRCPEATVRTIDSRSPSYGQYNINAGPSEHRLFRITELLNAILRFAGPVAQIGALRVSRTWRSSALDILSSHKNIDAFRTSQLSAPVEYGQLIDETTVMPHQPSSEEIESFGVHALQNMAKRPKTRHRKVIYFPARFTQLRGLPDSLAQELTHLDSSQRDDYIYGPVHATRNTGLYWLDLSQFTINPYLDAFFAEDDQITHRLGRWEIRLNAAATSETLILNSFLSSKVLLDAIASMQVTDPPCRAIGIYHYDASMPTPCGCKGLLTRVRNNDGVRIGELLEAVKRSAPTVLATWRVYSERLVGEIQRRTHWIDDMWNIPGAPTLEIHLDNVDMPDFTIDKADVGTGDATRDAFNAAAIASLGLSGHITRVAQMTAKPFRRSREREWVSEDLIEPAESTTGRHPINWDT